MILKTMGEIIICIYIYVYDYFCIVFKIIFKLMISTPLKHFHCDKF